jgi:photosystem II stability/assembly factor-like uncharacterized protein
MMAIGSVLMAAGVQMAWAADAGKPFASAQGKPYHFIRAIAVDPVTPGTIYVATDNQGLLKSVDGGKSWAFINAGIKNYLVYDVKISPTTANRLYAATWGGGFYQSDDGATWREINDGLGNTAAGEIAVQADAKGQFDRLYLGTSTELYERRSDQTLWRSITDRLRIWNGPQFQSALIVGPDGASLYLGTERGLYTRPRGARGWKEVPALKGKRIAALAVQPTTGRLYAGTIADGGPFISRDQGATWQPAGAGLEKSWIRAILLDPAEPKRIYVATSGAGVLKSDDDGATWAAINVGLPDKDIRALAIDPQHPEHLYAGTHGPGLFHSSDSGATWGKLEGLPFEPVEKQTAAIDTQTIVPVGPPSGPPPTKPVLPAAFSKCNQCHGWTDPALNQKPTYWRVAANRRNWRSTVARMSEGTTISPDEQAQITAFLDRFTAPEPPRPTPPGKP